MESITFYIWNANLRTQLARFFADAKMMLLGLAALGFSPGLRLGAAPRPMSMHGGVTKGEVHGEGGAYVAGYWEPLADCGSRFNIAGGSNEDTPRAVRSATAASAAKPDGTYDVAIIGAGCIGAAVARELAKTQASVMLLESADDVCQGATKGNSGIVHAGFDDTPGTVRAALCWKGNQMFPALDEDLHFGYQLTGSLVVARGQEEEEMLKTLVARGKTNGVKNLRIVGKKELFEMEPNLDSEATAALLSPDAGTLIPYEYTIALAENAADNGVEVRIRRTVESIASPGEDGLFEVSLDHWEPQEYVSHELSGGLGNYYGGDGEGGPWEKFPVLKKQTQQVSLEDMKVGGSGSRRAMQGVSVGKEKVRARYVVNCAGGASDKVARMVGDESFTIKPRLGECGRRALWTEQLGEVWPMAAGTSPIGTSCSRRARVARATTSSSRAPASTARASWCRRRCGGT